LRARLGACAQLRLLKRKGSATGEFFHVHAVACLFQCSLLIRFAWFGITSQALPKSEKAVGEAGLTIKWICREGWQSNGEVGNGFAVLEI
jgi:hypothetical protein